MTGEEGSEGRHPTLPCRPPGKFFPTLFTSPPSSTHPPLPTSSIWPPARSQEQFHLAQILKEKQLFVPSTRGKVPNLLQRHLFTCQGKEKRPLGLPNPGHPAEDKSCFSSGTTGGCRRQSQRPCQPSTPLTPPRGCPGLKNAASLLLKSHSTAHRGCHLGQEIGLQT